jgi:5-methylcytosine-specific restriction endonuclease McrA
MGDWSGASIRGGTDLSLAIVRAGLAWHYKQYSTDRALADAELEARARKVGLWSHANPIPPWEYRHPKRVELASQAGPFHGNRRSGVFHRPGCPNYECPNCIIVFKTHDEAVKAGFRPAGDCLR